MNSKSKKCGVNKNIQKSNYIDYKKLCENAHIRYITNFAHSIYNNKDLIISISTDDSNIKLWNIDNWSCILNL